jgi:hypothetical protein
MNYFIRTTTLALLFFSISTSAQQEVSIDKAYIKATQKLLKNKKIKAAFERIEQLDPLTVKRHIELTEIEAPPFKEEKRAKVFADYFNQLGMDTVWIDSEGKCFGFIKRKSRRKEQ